MGARDAGILIELIAVLSAAPLPAASAAERRVLAASAESASPAWAESLAAVPESLAVAAAADTLAALPDTGGRAFPSVRDSVVLLPEIRVDRERARGPALRVPTGFATEIRVSESRAALDLLPELLRQVPGVHVQQYGGLGAFSTMSVRGSTPGQVTIYLDGMPLTSAAHSVVSLADVPLSSIDRVEVYRGAVPLGFSQTGASGAINLVRASGATTPELRVSWGSFDTWDARAAAGLTRGAWAGHANVGYQGSAGDFLWFDENGTPFNSTDDSVTTRINNRFDSFAADASVDWKGPIIARARAGWFEKRQGLAGVGSVSARNARLAFRREQEQIELIAPPARRWIPRAVVRAGHAGERTSLRDTRGELGFGAHDSDDRLGHEHLDLECSWLGLPWSSTFEAGGSLRAEESRPKDPADPFEDPPPSHRSTRGAMVAFQTRALGGPLLLRLAQRWDRHEDHLRATGVGGVTAADATRRLRAPQAGARLALPLGLEARANWAEAERAPDFLELFGNQGGVLGNSALIPETVRSWDAGGSWTAQSRVGQASLSWAHFESRARDLILYVRVQNGVRAQNVTRAFTRGDELSLALGRGSLALAASFTWQDARDVGDVPYWTGRRLPQRPGREADVRLSWERSHVGLGAELHHLGDNYLDRYNRYRLASRTLLGAWASITPAFAPIRFVVEGKNLGDDRTSDVAGYPLPGRSAFLALETRLRPHL